MEFSEAQYQGAIDKIRSGLAELNAKIAQIPAAANAAVNRPDVPEDVRNAVIWLAKKLVDILTAVVNKISELLQGAIAPILMFRYAHGWQDVRGMTSGVVGILRPEALRVNRYWTGQANDAYNRAVKPQSEAAAKIGTIAERTSASLNVCAAAGLAFYIALGVIVVKLVLAAAAAIAALGSLVLSWAGLAIIVEEAAVTPAMIIAAVVSLTALLGAQASQMAVLHGEAIDTSAFPGGNWPDSTSDTFSDATVLDGDAKWSLRSP